MIPNACKKIDTSPMDKRFARLAATDATSRPQALLRLMRTSELFADITVLVGMHTFKVHRSVVSYLSPICYKLFARASSNPSSCLKIHQTSPAAWSVLLDFAYVIDVEERLGKDLELAMDVASVAGHFQAQQLRGIALKFADVTLSTLGGVIHKLQGGTEVNWAIS